VQALSIRRKAHELSALFSGKMPTTWIVPGGDTETATVDKIASFLWRLNEIRHFIDTVYIPDVLAVAGVYSDHFGVGRGCGEYLAYGVFDMDGREADLPRLPSVAAPFGRQPRRTRAARSEKGLAFLVRRPSAATIRQRETAPGRQESLLKSPRYDGSQLVLARYWSYARW
jgi:Ni,Fe-hydrogenase I large subunit